MPTRNAPLVVQSTVATSTGKFGDFKPIVGTTGSTLHVLEIEANHPKSMKLLDQAGLMPYTRKEMLSILVKDEQLKEYLKRKSLYLAETGAKERDLYTVNEDGSITQGKGTSIENTVRVWHGNNPLSLGVLSDDNASYYGWRFILVADSEPDDVAPVVVGKPKLSLSEPADKLLSEIEDQTASLRRSETTQGLGQKVVELGTKVADLAKMLRPT